MEELHLSSVIEASSPWKEREVDTYLSKIVKMDNDICAILLKDSPNKSLRYIYLSMLMSKKNFIHLQTLTNKISQIKLSKTELPLINIPSSEEKLVPSSIPALYSAIEEITKKLDNHSYSHNAILKITHQFSIVDPILIAALRTIAEDNKMNHALDWSTELGMGPSQALWGKIVKEKENSAFSGRNKCILFYPLTQLEIDFFQKRGVIIAKESECFEELSENQNLRYQQFIMIQKVYSLLE